jgi:hypothetical protein
MTGYASNVPEWQRNEEKAPEPAGSRPLCAEERIKGYTPDDRRWLRRCPDLLCRILEYITSASTSLKLT